MDHTLQFLADYATSLKYQTLPQEAIHQVKRRIIDSLGCAMGAYWEEPSKIARAYALEATSRPGATVLGTRHRTAPELAAFANGSMVRYLDFSDTSMAIEAGHPSGNIPGVLAAAEYAGADIRTVITGIVLAYEVQGRFGEAALLRDKGWDGVTYVAISSAAGAGKALGLNREQMGNALALAATANVALRQTRVGALSMWKGCAEANACRSGVFAALIAGKGLTGPEEAFEGPKGFFKQVTGPINLPTFGGKGKPFKVEDAKFKYMPAEYHNQCIVQPAIELYKALEGKVDDIERVVVEAYDIAVDATADSPDKWNPMTRETADHSLPYVLAVTLTRGSLWLDDFNEDKIKDPTIRALMHKIEVHRNAEFTKTYPETNCFRIEVITKSGEKHVREIRYAKGHPKNPMTDQEIEAKFRKLSEPVLKSSRINQILDRLWRLEDVRSLRDVFIMFVTGKP